MNSHINFNRFKNQACCWPREFTPDVSGPSDCCCSPLPALQPNISRQDVEQDNKKNRAWNIFPPPVKSINSIQISVASVEGQINKGKWMTVPSRVHSSILRSKWGSAEQERDTESDLQQLINKKTCLWHKQGVGREAALTCTAFCPGWSGGWRKPTGPTCF